MTSCSTYNRSQSLFDDSGINATISESEIVALISQTVQAAMAAERAKVLSSTLSPESSSIASATIGGVPAMSPCSLTPATIIAQPCAVRAVSSSSIIVPWFLSTFAAAAMSALSLASCAASFLGGPSRNSGHVSVASVLQPSALALADQLFVVGPGVSPVLAKFVSQISWLGTCGFFGKLSGLQVPEQGALHFASHYLPLRAPAPPALVLIAYLFAHSSRFPLVNCRFLLGRQVPTYLECLRMDWSVN